MTQTSTRAGKYVAQPSGYSAFSPSFLPPSPPLEVDEEILLLLSDASIALGRLDGVADTLPNPDLFVMMYVKKEAVLSSQIEGTQASLSHILELESNIFNPDRPNDVEEIVSYVGALKYGLERLQTLPLSLRLIREIHGKLLENSRGIEKSPGEFRTSQNWIGPPGSNLKTARFVPPALDDMRASLGQWESYLHTNHELPPLIKAGIAHAQFETIHPFLDGNGRIGRLFITFYLCEQGILKLPLLYLSHYFKQNRSEYYDRLQSVRDKGDWEGWIKFFLSGVFQVGNEATQVAKSILSLRENHRSNILAAGKSSSMRVLNVYETLFSGPFVTAKLVSEHLGIPFRSASRIIDTLVEQGILEETTGRSRDRVYVYKQYLKLFENSEHATVEIQQIIEDSTQTN